MEGGGRTTGVREPFDGAPGKEVVLTGSISNRLFSAVGSMQTPCYRASLMQLGIWVELTKTTELHLSLEEGGEGNNKLGFRGETGQGVHDNILQTRNVGDAEAQQPLYVV